MYKKNIFSSYYEKRWLNQLQYCLSLWKVNTQPKNRERSFGIICMWVGTYIPTDNLPINDEHCTEKIV